MSVGQFEVVPKAVPTPGQVVGRASFFDENGDPIDLAAGGATGPKGDKGDTGAAGTPGTAGSKGDKGDTGAAGTTPPVGTAALLTAGTDTVSRSWSAKDIADYVAAQVAP